MVAALKDSMLDKRTAMHDRVVKCTSLGKKWAVASRLPQYYSCPASLRSISHNFLLQELGVPKSCLRRCLTDGEIDGTGYERSAVHMKLTKISEDVQFKYRCIILRW